MGTRSVIKFQEEGQTLCAIYQQYDGYPDGVGKTLAEFLAGITMVNGITMNETRKIANGVGCLAAQFIAEQKDGVGGLYMTSLEDSQQYNYTVNCRYEGEGWNAAPSDIEVTVESHEGVEFRGTVEEFGFFIDTYNDPDDEEVA